MPKVQPNIKNSSLIWILFSYRNGYRNDNRNRYGWNKRIILLFSKAPSSYHQTPIWLVVGGAIQDGALMQALAN